MESYEPWLEPFVPLHGRAAIDVGANTGIWTRWLANGYQIVYAIEPNPEVVKELRAHLPANVLVEQVAAWSSEGNLEFNLYAAPGHTSAYFKGEGIQTGKPTGRKSFPAQTLDAIVGTRTTPVDFVKIDTEGAEYEVLVGASGLLGADRPKLIIEVHSPENEERIGVWLALRDYKLDVVRNPNFPRGSAMWKSHCWVIATS